MKYITSAITLILISLLLFLPAGCSTDTTATGISSAEPITYSTYYTDIPGLTKEERLAIEHLKADKENVSYAILSDTASDHVPDSIYQNFTSDFYEILGQLFDMEFIPESFNSRQELEEALYNGSVDFTCDLSIGSKQGQIDYISDPIAIHIQHLYTLADSDRINIETDVSGLRLGFFKNSLNWEIIKEHYPDLSFEVILVENIPSIESMLLSGEMDAFVSEMDLDIYFDDSEHIQSKKFFPLAYAPVSLSTADSQYEPFLSVLNKYLNAGGFEYLYGMYTERELEQTKSRLLHSLTDAEQAYLDDLLAVKTVIRMGVDHDNYPINFYNTEEKEFQGIAMDILDEISELTGISFEITSSPSTAWSEISDDLMTNRISMVPHLGFSQKRRQYFIFSEIPYTRYHYAMISRSDFPNIEGYQISNLKTGALAQSIYEEKYREWFPNSDNIIVYDTEHDAFDALEKGEIDLVIGAEYTLMTQVNYREKTDYKINYRSNELMGAVFGFHNSETLLCGIINKAQKFVDTETIVEYWNGRVFDYEKKISQMQSAYLLVFSSVVLLILMILLIQLLRNKRLGKKLLERTTTLSVIYSSIPDIVFSKDEHGFFTSCNPSFEQYAGMKEEELVGKRSADIFSSHDSELVASHAEADSIVIQKKTPFLLEETLTYPDGTHKKMETLKVPLIQNETVVGILGIGRDITERIEAKERLERIINTAQIAFILTVDGIVKEMNEYSRTHIGVKEGDTFCDFYADPVQRSGIMDMLTRQEIASNLIVKFKMVNGETHRFLASFSETEYENRHAYIMWAPDIEQDEQKNDDLRITRRSLQTVLDSLAIPVRILDIESQNIVYVNDSLLQFLAYDSADEVCGKDISCMLPKVQSNGTYSADLIKQITENTSENALSSEIEYRSKTGRVIESLVVTRLIDYNGRPSSIGIIKDLTEERERERMMRSVAEKEKEANQLKSLFLANMSHEIRTPMNGILGMTELLLCETLSGRQFQYVRDIKTSAESLLGIINDILDLSKIGEGKLQITEVDVDLSLLLKNIVSMMSFSAHSKGLNFIDDIRINSPEYVKIDDIRLTQIMINLLSNAVKFTKSGHVKLMVAIKNDSIVFEISDTGIGIRQEDIPLIFTAFEQVSKNKNRAIKGTGLGLSISKNLAELMHGEIRVESEYGTGSTFSVILPYVKGDETAIETSEAEFTYLSAPTANILLVDDIQTNLTVGAGLLRLCGITADVALSGREAIELVKAKDYDIVFMDHMMPEMNGIEAMNIIKSLGGRFIELPIIALTANAVNESRDMLLASGMSDFLSKPIDKSMLVSILQKWLPPHKIRIENKSTKTELGNEYTELLKNASKIKGLDIELALNRLNGMSDVLEASLKQTAYSIDHHLKKMDMHLSSENLSEFAIEAHGMKGAFSNIGATHYSELAAELEIASKAENMQLCHSKFPVFADLIENFAIEVQSIFSLPDETGKTPGDSSLLKAKAEEAMFYLNNFESADALICLAELDKFSFGAEINDLLNDAKSTAEAFGYEKAILLLEKIMQMI